MGKILVEPSDLIYPQPVLLVGANVNNKPNFLTASWVGIANGNPPMVSVAIRHNRYTLKGIKQNMTFSVNVPSTDTVKETDYCGLVSGSKVDKVEVCRFKVFYGKLASSPLIEQCPVNLECKVVHILDLGSHSLVIGRIRQAHVSEDCLTDGEPDINKIKPLVFITGLTGQYHALGELVAKAYSIGKELATSEY
jgi:flavin reductase (DIM6/NTAB) family NADH-FMN oxidoreductase RutF